MKKILYTLFLFLAIACGKGTNSPAINGVTNTINTSPIVNMDGTITIPAAGIIGSGVATIYFNSVPYQYSANGSSSTAQNYVNQLINHQVPVYPIFQNQGSTQYRIHFTGTFAQGPCMTNPTAQCPLAFVQSMAAY